MDGGGGAGSKEPDAATVFGEVVQEHGALSYREFLGDDLGEKLEVESGLALTAAVAEFESRAHRDAVMGKVMEDPRVVELIEGEQLAEMSEMSYGGFETPRRPRSPRARPGRAPRGG
jgi:uncharacterized protein YbaA (DUF1428 family)